MSKRGASFDQMMSWEYLPLVIRASVFSNKFTKACGSVSGTRREIAFSSNDTRALKLFFSLKAQRMLRGQQAVRSDWVSIISSLCPSAWAFALSPETFWRQAVC